MSSVTNKPPTIEAVSFVRYSYKDQLYLILSFFICTAIILLLVAFLISYKIQYESLVKKYNTNEVFLLNYDDGTYSSPLDAESACTAQGAALANVQQVTEAYLRGASWCQWGWVSDGYVAYPMNDADKDTCDGLGGVQTSVSIRNAGAVCYGKKPSVSTSGMTPFNKTKYSMYS
jgi:hypothetical protein